MERHCELSVIAGEWCATLHDAFPREPLLRYEMGLRQGGETKSATISARSAPLTLDLTLHLNRRLRSKVIHDLNPVIIALGFRWCCLRPFEPVKALAGSANFD